MRKPETILISLLIVLVSILHSNEVQGQLIKIAPTSRSVLKRPNESYSVACQIIQDDGKGEWFAQLQALPEQKVSNSTSSRIRQKTSSDNTGIDLLLTDLKHEDSGSYTCRFKSISVSFRLIVLPPVEFDQSLSEQWATEGTHYKVKCPAIEQPNEKWQTVWKIDDRNPEIYFPKFKVMNDGLVIYNITQRDADRKYVCRVDQVDAQIPRFSVLNITLHVFNKDSPAKPSKIDGSAPNEVDAWGVPGYRAQIYCGVVARPSPTFEWIRLDKILTPISDYYKITYNGSSSTLQITIRSQQDFGEYICRAKNSLGGVEQIFNLKKAQKPPTPSIVPQMIGSNYVSMRMNYNPPDLTDPPVPSRPSQVNGKELPVNGRIIEYKRVDSESFLTADQNTEDYNNGFMLTGLQPGTAYLIQAALTNAAAIGDYSQAVKITTDKERGIEKEANHDCSDENNDETQNCTLKGNSAAILTFAPESRSFGLNSEEPEKNNAITKSISSKVLETISKNGTHTTVTEITIEETHPSPTSQSLTSVVKTVTKIYSKTVKTSKTIVSPEGTTTISNTTTEEMSHTLTKPM